MAHVAPLKADKIAHPQTYYETPDDLLNDQELSADEKKNALDVSEQDARQLLTASNEGMPGSEEGHAKSDTSRLGQVERAKGKLGEQLQHKPAH
jgi:hypothetical protein